MRLTHVGIDELEERARNARRFFGVAEPYLSTPRARLLGRLHKKVALACATMKRPQILLLLDEHTCHINVGSILEWRRLIADCVGANSTIVLVSHDRDLMNGVGTYAIYICDQKLGYYAKQAGSLKKQRSAMVQSIEHLKKKSHQANSQAMKKELNRAVKSKEKKLEPHGGEKNNCNHRWTDKNNSGM
ncbi:hypothetical protein ACHAWF_011191 [Thalassiosira exigua]